MKIIRVFLIFILISSFVGCAQYYAQQNSLLNAAMNKQDLTGMTQEEILNTFGQPNSTNTSYFMNSRYDMWTYQKIFSFADATYYFIGINFKDGRVQSVHYGNPVHA